MSIGSWKTEEVLSLKVTLRGIRPPIWRRLEVPSRLPLSALHDAIHAAMGWEGHHLYVSDVPRRRYGDPAPVDGVADDARLTVGGVLKSGVGRFSYTYDFGEDWVHEIEGMKVAAGGRRYPASAAGKRNCPPQDCGGIWGYGDLVTALADPSRCEADEWSEWMQLGFDPEQFSVEIVDARVGAR